MYKWNNRRYLWLSLKWKTFSLRIQIHFSSKEEVINPVYQKLKQIDDNRIFPPASRPLRINSDKYKLKCAIETKVFWSNLCHSQQRISNILINCIFLLILTRNLKLFPLHLFQAILTIKNQKEKVMKNIQKTLQKFMI